MQDHQSTPTLALAAAGDPRCDELQYPPVLGRRLETMYVIQRRRADLWDDTLAGKSERMMLVQFATEGPNVWDAVPEFDHRGARAAADAARLIERRGSHVLRVVSQVELSALPTDTLRPAMLHIRTLPGTANLELTVNGVRATSRRELDVFGLLRWWKVLPARRRRLVVEVDEQVEANAGTIANWIAEALRSAPHAQRFYFGPAEEVS